VSKIYSLLCRFKNKTTRRRNGTCIYSRLIGLYGCEQRYSVLKSIWTIRRENFYVRLEQVRIFLFLVGLWSSSTLMGGISVFLKKCI
jgi:hypothetical protein